MRTRGSRCSMASSVSIRTSSAMVQPDTFQASPTESASKNASRDSLPDGSTSAGRSSAGGAGGWSAED
ncbi:hypothetical protein LCGC14_2300760, partial [marine sediment metagenome]